jgi:hypothetical protein
MRHGVLAAIARSRISLAVSLCGLLFAVACGSSPTSPSDASPPVPSGPRTYYVAANEPGADNTRCDGLSPRDEGGNRCPFRDFRSSRTAGLLRGVASVRVEVRTGTYTFVGEGLSLDSTARSAAETSVLAAYAGEQPIFDGEEQLNGTVRVSGQYANVEGITFVRGGGANLEVRGGRFVRLTRNRFLSNRTSDSLKGSGGAADVEIRDNEFTGWDSQAIDMTGNARWTIADNVFHDPLQPRAKAIGAKLGSRDIIISGNTVRNAGGIALGGTSAAHSESNEVSNMAVQGNRLESIGGHAATFYSCVGCRFTDNSVDRAERGVRLGGVAIEGPSGCAGGCEPTRDAVVSRNRLRGLTGDGEAPPDLFWLVEGSERQGLTAADNTYCVSPGQEARFAFAVGILSFADWVRGVQTDGSSVVVVASDARCQGW